MEPENAVGWASSLLCGEFERDEAFAGDPARYERRYIIDDRFSVIVGHYDGIGPAYRYDGDPADRDHLHRASGLVKFLNLAKFAALHGYRKVREKYTQKNPVLEHPETGHRILISKNRETGHFLYTTVKGGDAETSDTIIGFTMEVSGAGEMSDVLKYIRSIDWSRVDDAEYLVKPTGVTTDEQRKIRRQFDGFPSLREVFLEGRRIIDLKRSRGSTFYPKSEKIADVLECYQVATQFVSGRAISAKLLSRTNAVIERKKLKGKNGGDFTVRNIAFPSHRIEERDDGRLYPVLTGFQNYRHKPGMNRYFTGSGSLWVQTFGKREELRYIAVAENPLDALSFLEYMMRKKGEGVRPEHFLMIATFGNPSAIGREDFVRLAKHYETKPILNLLDTGTGGEAIAKALFLPLAESYSPALVKDGRIDTSRSDGARLAKRIRRVEPPGKDWNEVLIAAVEKGEMKTRDVEPFYLEKKNDADALREALQDEPPEAGFVTAESGGGEAPEPAPDTTIERGM